MQINTASPLEHHWVLASVSVAPVASQCTCGSSDLPVWSVQWYPSVLTESGLEVIRSSHFPACNPLCIHLVWWELFELNWFHLTYNPKCTKTIMVLTDTKGIHRAMLKYSHVLRAEMVSIADQWTPSKGWIYRDLSNCLLVSRHLVISNWHGCYSAHLYVSGCVWAVTVHPVVFHCRLQKLEFLQWHPSVGRFELSFSSGTPVWGCFN